MSVYILKIKIPTCLVMAKAFFIERLWISKDRKSQKKVLFYILNAYLCICIYEYTKEYSSYKHQWVNKWKKLGDIRNEFLTWNAVVYTLHKEPLFFYSKLEYLLYDIVILVFESCLRWIYTIAASCKIVLLLARTIEIEMIENSIV